MYKHAFLLFSFLCDRHSHTYKIYPVRFELDRVMFLFFYRGRPTIQGSGFNPFSSLGLSWKT
jgi:hypothetical protein